MTAASTWVAMTWRDEVALERLVADRLPSAVWVDHGRLSSRDPHDPGFQDVVRSGLRAARTFDVCLGIPEPGWFPEIVQRTSNLDGALWYGVRMPKVHVFIYRCIWFHGRPEADRSTGPKWAFDYPLLRSGEIVGAWSSKEDQNAAFYRDVCRLFRAMAVRGGSGWIAHDAARYTQEAPRRMIDGFAVVPKETEVPRLPVYDGTEMMDRGDGALNPNVIGQPA